MKFHFETYELSEAEVELLNHYGSIGSDMCIVFEGQAESVNRMTFNTCVMLLAWKVPENYGIQRIPVGTEEHHTRKWWAKQLRDGVHDAKIEKRIADLAVVFEGEQVETLLMGFMLKRTDFKDHTYHLRCAPDELLVKVEPDAQDSFCAGLETKGHAIH